MGRWKNDERVMRSLRFRLERRSNFELEVHVPAFYCNSVGARDVLDSRQKPENYRYRSQVQRLLLDSKIQATDCERFEVEVIC